MRARLMTLEGVALAEEGDSAAQVERFEKVMEIDPSVFRRLRIALPVRFSLGSVSINKFPMPSVVHRDLKSTMMDLRSMFSPIRCVFWVRWVSSSRVLPFRFVKKNTTDGEYVTAITEQFHTMAFAILQGCQPQIGTHSMVERPLLSSMSQKRIQGC